AHVYRIATGNWNAGTLTSVVTATAAAASATANPDPPSVTPAWGADDTLWIAVAGGDTWASTTSAPAGFTNEGDTVAGSGTTGANVASAILGATTATENPGTFTMGASAT